MVRPKQYAGVYAALCAASLLCFTLPAKAAPLLPSSQVAAPQSRSPDDVLRSFLGTPYRIDGVINDQGAYALFANTQTPLAGPGLNCSGFVLAAARALLGKPVSVAKAVHDRQGDSGPGAARGKDWDFGFDLIMNISEGTAYTLLLPQGVQPPTLLTGDTAPTWNINDQSFASEFIAQVQPGTVCLLSFSRHPSPTAPPRNHYHVALVVRDRAGAVWLYSTTNNSGRVIRVNLTTAEGLARFRHSFRSLPGSYKRLTILEVLPEGL